MFEVVRKRRELKLRVLGKSPVKRAEKIIGVLRVMLPGIFPIHDDRHHLIRVALTTRGDFLQVLHEIGDCVVGMPGGIGKADKVREAVIAEKQVSPVSATEYG